MKRKNIVLILLSIITPILCVAQNYFIDGTEWITKVTGTHTPDSFTTIERVSLKETPDSPYLEMYLFDNSEDNSEPQDEFIAYIKSDGDKVYFKLDDKETSEWYLYYDFSIQVGEGNYFYSIPKFNEENPRKSFLKCIDKKVTEDDGEIVLELYTDDTCTTLLGSGIWIQGIGSKNGVLYNNNFGIVGVGSVLTEVSNRGDIIYSYSDSSNVSNIISDSGIKITLKGNMIYVTSEKPECGDIFTESGIIIGNYNFDKEPNCINLPSGGVYIIRIGEYQKKIIVR